MAWSDLDILILDLALLIVKKAINMVNQLGKPIRGLVENISFLISSAVVNMPLWKTREEEIYLEPGMLFERFSS